jgi:hypothetical protein
MSIEEYAKKKKKSISELTHEDLTRWYQKKLREKRREHKKIHMRKNPYDSSMSNKPMTHGLIYGSVLAIEAQKNKNSKWGKEKFRHDFSSKDAEIIGQKDGSILIKSRSGKRLWKSIRYD